MYSLHIGSVLVITVSIAAGLLVMVSSELVVLLIVCVGINTGSAQGELHVVTHTHTHTLIYNLIIVHFPQDLVKMKMI